MNAEMDATVGPILRKKAEDAGVIYTVTEGDQPGVQMNLYRWVKTLG
jgi:predicted homoserine dehydrogenase-like protein